MLFLWLLIPTGGAFLFEENLLTQRRLTTDSLALFNFTGATPACRKDINRWQRSLLLFAGEFSSCVLNNTVTGTCTPEKKKDMMKNLYGLKQLDAFGRTPAGVLDIKTTAYGDLQECQEVSQHFYYPTQYCFVHSEIAMKGKTICEEQQSAVFRTAVCMPKSCNEEDILNLVDQYSQLGLMNHCSVSCKKDEGSTDAFTWIFLAVMSILVGLLLLASALDYILESFYQQRCDKVKQPALRLLLAFSIFTNGGLIWNTLPPREGHLKCLDCIRFLSMVWVASGHVFNFYLNNDAKLPIITLPRPILVDTLMSSFFSVDTFFVLSGLLVSYLFFKAAAKSPQMVKSPWTWLLFYVHRYLRLTPPYMLFICFIIAVTPLMTGVLMSEWDAPDTLIEPCVQYWWRNLLYINNFGTGPFCYNITWYLAVDMQLYIVAPLFLLAFFFSPWAGMASVVLSCVASSIATVILTIHYNLPATAARPEKGQEFNDYLYVKPWIRCPPYLIGIAAGYFLAKYQIRRVKIHWGIPLLGWLASIAVALAILYGPHEYLAVETNWAKGVRGFYNAGSRIGWALFIVWVVGANHFGCGGPVANFMEHPIWQPLGRLSYTAYLCHMFLVMYQWNLQDRPLHFDGVWSQFVQFTLPVVVMAYFFAFFWSCLCEIPFFKLEKMLIDALISRRKTEKAPPAEETTPEAWKD